MRQNKKYLVGWLLFLLSATAAQAMAPARTTPTCAPGSLATSAEACLPQTGVVAQTPPPPPIPVPDPNAAPDCSQGPGSLPAPNLPPGTRRTDIPIKHVVIIMQENRTFDNYFGSLAQDGYAGYLDGQSSSLGNLDSNGNFIATYHQTAACVPEADQQWNESLTSLDNLTNGGFYKTNGLKSLGYYNSGDLQFIYALANRFAVGDRFFSSALTSTYPNRMFEMAGTSFGYIHDDEVPLGATPAKKTIFDVMSQYGIAWKYYAADVPGLAILPDTLLANEAHLASGTQFISDALGGKIPEVSFVDMSMLTGTEYASYDHFVGAAAAEDTIRAILGGSAWSSTVLFFVFDESGGTYDHVVPPRACQPDSIPLHYHTGDVPGALDRYGFRVPFLAVSPYAKQHYVSHTVYDHTSMLRFIETKFNLPALTYRDANASPLLDLFDFSSPNTSVPTLPRTVVDPDVLAHCLATVKPEP